MKRLWLLALPLLLSACPHRPIEFGPEGEITDAKQMISLLMKQDARFVTLEGDVRLKVDSPQGSGTVSQYVAVTRPGGLHIETFNFFGKPVSVLITDGDQFSLYDADHNTFYRGPATVETMSRFLPIALAPEEAVALILGQVPRLPVKDGKLVLNADKRRYELTLELNGIRQTLYIEPKNLDIQRSVISGAASYDLALEDYKDAPGGRFPHTVTFDAPASHVTLTYKYPDAVKINAAPNLALFHMEPPASAKIVELDAQGQEPKAGMTSPSPAPQPKPASP